MCFSQVFSLFFFLGFIGKAYLSGPRLYKLLWASTKNETWVLALDPHYFLSALCTLPHNQVQISLCDNFI